MNATTTVTLIATTMLFTNADSETPRTSQVTAAMAMTAGRFTTPVPTTSPDTKSVTGVPHAPRNATGMSSPRSCRKLATYPTSPRPPSRPDRTRARAARP